MGRPIPEIRERLLQIADELVQPLLFPRPLDDIAKEIRRLVVDAVRNAPVTQAPVRSRRMTRELAAQICAFQAEHPDWTQQAIAEHFGVIAGRVSEALNGKKKR
jgi:hypothetical protein